MQGLTANRLIGPLAPQILDEEIKQIVNESYEEVRNILEEKRDKLGKVANLLLEKEVIEGEELRKLIA